MTEREFELRAKEIFERIPEAFKEGVDGLEVVRRALAHPTLPDIYTLGECRSEFYPSEFGGAGEVRSFVVLYYGSFVRLSELDDRFDWEEELIETITHEVRHHLESLASEDDLEVQDYVEDQNFNRREGEPFDPHFYRGGAAVAEGAFEVDGDLFVDHVVGDEERTVHLEWGGETFDVPVPDPLGDVHFLTLRRDDEGRELLLVLQRKQGWWASLTRVLAGRTTEVLCSDVSPPDERPEAGAER